MLGLHPVVAEVKEGGGLQHQGCRGRAESEIMGFGCSVFRVYRGGQAQSVHEPLSTLSGCRR